MKSENPSELRVRNFLENQGFDVGRIQVNEKDRRADYKVRDESDTYIVEVKGRAEDEEYLEDLFRKGVAEKQKLLGRTNTMSGLIQEAADQLRSTPCEEGAFRIAAFVASTEDADVDLEQFESTLYGTVNLLTEEEDGIALATPCFYFTFNEFYRLPDVDAALIFAQRGSKLYLNTFSQRVEAFRRARLYELYDQHNAVVDPGEMERRETAFVADCNLDRRDEKALSDYNTNTSCK
ncbi:hypothetical protein MYX78_13375 [Acidobacteria bacterium AH-259-G07]|nr:hypothetical protein [Acidobacteria bacterium AH-259-G07]